MKDIIRHEYKDTLSQNYIADKLIFRVKIQSNQLFIISLLLEYQNANEAVLVTRHSVKIQNKNIHFAYIIYEIGRSSKKLWGLTLKIDKTNSKEYTHHIPSITIKMNDNGKIDVGDGAGGYVT